MTTIKDLLNQTINQAETFIAALEKINENQKDKKYILTDKIDDMINSTKLVLSDLKDCKMKEEYIITFNASKEMKVSNSYIAYTETEAIGLCLMANKNITYSDIISCKKA